jgi:hypothetical protein
MTSRTVVGLKPWLPWPLSQWPWWTEPVRAERLAVLRIGLAGLLLVDLLLTFLPRLTDFYGADSLGTPELFAYVRREPRWFWSFLGGVTDPHILRIAMLAWIIATASLLLGYWTRISAVLVWALAISFDNVNHYVGNAGDEVRTIILLYLVLSPCGAVWSVDHWLRRRRLGDSWSPVFVPPWPLRLLFVQMSLIYFANGMYKFSGHNWPAGDSLYYVLGDMTLARWSFAQVPVPYALTQVLTWTVLYWEMAFPLLMLLPWLAQGFCEVLRIPARGAERVDRLLRALRVITLCFGAAFHLGILLTMEIGFFPLYMLCLYLPLLPWERVECRLRLSAGAWSGDQPQR